MVETFLSLLMIAQSCGPQGCPVPARVATRPTRVMGVSGGRPAAEGQPPRAVNRDAIESSVRIRVVGPRSTGYGSGTIIDGDSRLALVITCGHIFHLEGFQKQQVDPSRFPRKILIDYKNNTYVGKALDYDFSLDVGLIQITPGEQLPSSRIVPSRWQPKATMSVSAVGYPEGGPIDYYRTVITRPRLTNFLSGRPDYAAVECRNAPHQGQSGGGLFTDDGHLIGICDFAEPQGNHGLYASPTSIYYMLERNGLTLEETTCRVFRRLFGRRGDVNVNVNTNVPVDAPPSSVVPFNPPVEPPVVVVTPSPSSPPTPTVQAFDPTAIIDMIKMTNNRVASVEKRVSAAEATLELPITFVTLNPDGSRIEEPVKLGGKLGFKIPKSASAPSPAK